MLERAAPVCQIVFTRRFPPFGIYHKLVRWQEFVDHLNSGLHVSAAIAAQIDDEVLHALDIHLGKRHKHLGIRVLSERLNSDITRVLVNHEIGIDALHRHVAAHYGEVHRFLLPIADNGQTHLRVLRAAQMLHDLLILHSYKALAVGRDNTVSSQQTHLLRRAALDDIHDMNGIVLDRKADADSGKTATQLFHTLLGILGANIARMRIQFGEDLRHSLLHDVVHIHSINVTVVNNLQQIVQFAAPCVDDTQAVTGEMISIERAYQNTDYDAQSEQYGNKTVLVLVIHILQ